MINLLPPEVKSMRRFGRYNRVIFGYSIAAITIGIFSMAIMMFNLQLINNEKQTVTKEIQSNELLASQLEGNQKTIDSIATDLDVIKALQEGEVKFSELIPKIAATLPSGAVLNSLALTGGSLDPLQLNLDIKNQDLAAILQQNLANSELFEAADIISISNKSEETSNGYPYQTTITVTFKGTAEKKKKEDAKKAAAAAQAKQEEAAKSGGSQ